MPIEHRLHARCAGFAAAARPFGFPTSQRHFERARPFAIEHLALDLSLDFDSRSVAGSASLRFRRVDPDAKVLELDAIGFSLDSVTLDGAKARFVYDGGRLTVDIPSTVERSTLIVSYRATPRKGLYFLGPDEHVPTRPKQAWTQCQEEDARYLFPCHDKPHVKMTTEARIRVPKGFFVLSNGALAIRTESGEHETFHWRMDEPHPSYLVTIVAGEFSEIATIARVHGDSPELEETVRVAARDVPVSYLFPRGRDEDARRTFGRTPDMISWFSQLVGFPYPWNKYSQVVVSDFIFGGMENTTATTMYEHILLDERAAIDVTSDDLIAHELAHQWFGDLVTCRDWSEGWLNEGFATFMEHVWREHHLGRDEYEYGIKHDLASYLGEASGRYRRPIVCQEYDAPLDLFDRHLYEKGGLVLHVLRTELGDNLFWKGISAYLHRHARDVVETRDLQRALEEVSGRSLGRRFEELVHRPGHPELDLSLSWEDGVLRGIAKQTQSTNDGVPNSFEVPIVLEIVSLGSGQSRRETVSFTSRSDSFAVPCPDRPRFVVVDPDMRILGDVRVTAPADMLRAQLTEAKSARGRWLAAESLSRLDDPPTIDALGARLLQEGEFWGVRVECASALGRIRAREGFDLLVHARGVAHPKVRRAVVDALGHFRTSTAVDALKPSALRDESYLVEAEAARALGKTRQSNAYEILLDVIDRSSWADVIAAGAIDGLGSMREERALPHLFARTRYGHPSRVRRAAVMAIPKISSDRKAREHLEEMLDDVDAMLRLDVVRALSELGDHRARAALRARLDVELDARVRRRIREAVRDLADKKHNVEVKDTIERLENEHRELRARVAKLEAQGTGQSTGTRTGQNTAKGSSQNMRRSTGGRAAEVETTTPRKARVAAHGTRKSADKASSTPVARASETTGRQKKGRRNRADVVSARGPRRTTTKRRSPRGS
jgi:aminopeptidase N